jgi:hypothetical protein
LGLTHPGNAARRRKAWHLPAAARSTKGDGRKEVSAKAGERGSDECRQTNRQGGGEEETKTYFQAKVIFRGAVAEKLFTA